MTAAIVLFFIGMALWWAAISTGRVVDRYRVTAALLAASMIVVGVGLTVLLGAV